MRRVFNITFSPTGGTQNVADCLCAAFSENFISADLCERFFDGSNLNFTSDDLCVFSVPSYAGRVPVTAAERLSTLCGNNAPAVLVCVYGNRAWEDTLLEMKNILSARGFRCIAAVAAIAEHSMLRQYAAGRPDAADRAQLTDFSTKISDLLKTGTDYEELIIPGNFPYRPIGAFLKPIVNDDCVSCGVCADMCPVGAIDAEEPASTDLEKCISCTRCISLCPFKARQLDENMLQMVEARIGKLMQDRKENELFLAAVKC